MVSFRSPLMLALLQYLITTVTAQDACEVISLFDVACESVSPGYVTSTEFYDRASCLCYSRQTYAPSIYDNFFQQCVTLVSEFDPAAYSSAIAVYDGPSRPCAVVGDVRATPIVDTKTTPTPILPGPTPTSPVIQTTPVPGLGVQTTPTPVQQDPPATTDPGALACLSMDSVFSSCSARINLATAAEADIYGCFCYAGDNWQPNVYDGARGSCLAYLTTADPAIYTSIIGTGAPVTSLCNAAGDFLHRTGTPLPSPDTPSSPLLPSTTSETLVVPPTQETSSTSFQSSSRTNSGKEPTSAGPSTAKSPVTKSSSKEIPVDDKSSSPTITASTRSLGGLGSISSAPSISLSLSVSTPLSGGPDLRACATITALQSSCEVQTPGFGTLTDFASAAPCLCYSGSTWEPQIYDGLWSSCVRYVSTGLPEVFLTFTASVSVVPQPCSSVGDVLQLLGTTFTTTTDGGRTITRTSGTSRRASSTSDVAIASTSSSDVGGRALEQFGRNPTFFIVVIVVMVVYG